MIALADEIGFRGVEVAAMESLSCLMCCLFFVLKDKNLSLLLWFLIASIMDTEPKTIGSE